MIKLLVLIFAVFSTSTYAYTPTLESLLRNGNNAEIADKTVVASLVLKEIIKNSSVSSDPESNEVESKELSEDKSPALIKNTNLKIVISSLEEKYPKLTQLSYGDNSFSLSALSTFKTYSFNNIHRIAKSNEFVESKFFYALLASLLRNDGKLLLQLFKSLDVPVVYNSELINQKKLSLLRSYRDYLKKIKNGEGDENLKNPLKSEEPELQKEISETLKSNFLNKDENLKRVKVDDEFFWVMRNGALTIKFDSSHRLKLIRLSTDLGTVEATCGKFVSFSSNLEFPEYIILKDLEGREFELKMSALRLINDSARSGRKRAKKYRKAVQENQIILDQQRPKFVL